MIAHDMRTPITVVRGFARILEDNFDSIPPDRRVELLRSIDSNALRADEFIDNLLQFARFEAGEFKYDPAPFDLGALVQRVTHELAESRHRSALDVHVAPNLPPALGDEARIAQVLNNLVSNAIK